MEEEIVKDGPDEEELAELEEEMPDEEVIADEEIVKEEGGEV